MKFAITGHTSGIGKAISKLCDIKGHSWIGFSRTTGYDIAEYSAKIEIVEQSFDCDVFINNAYHEYAQVELLYKIWTKWRTQHKQIVCISSVPGRKSFLIDELFDYSVHKAALDHACEQLQTSSSECTVTNIQPSYVDTLVHKGNNAIDKINPEHLANNILWCIEQPVHIQMIKITA